MREELLQQVKLVNDSLKPEHFVHDMLREVNGEVLSDIEPDLERLLPSPDFGNEYFNENLVNELRAAYMKRGIEPLILMVNSNSFEKLYYWLAEEVYSHSDNLLRFMTSLASDCFGKLLSLYYQAYQQYWVPQKGQKLTLDIVVDRENNQSACTRNLSRYSLFEPEQDRVVSLFTDYYGKQVLYIYLRGFFSRANIHGSYFVVFKQSEITPGAILERAQKARQDGVLVAIVEKSDLGKTDLSSEELTMTSNLPTEFWHQWEFFNLNGFEVPDVSADTHLISVSIPFSDELLRLKRIEKNGKYLIVVLLVLLAMVSLYSVFSLPLPVFRIKTKLALILGVIVLIPLAGTAFLTWSAKSAESMIVERQTRLQVENMLEEFAKNLDEMNLRTTICALELKGYAQQALTSIDNAFERLAQMPVFRELVLPFRRLIIVDKSLQAIEFNTVIFNVHKSANPLGAAFMSKYITDMGLSGSGTGMGEKVFTLATFEDVLPPEIEEAFIINEGTYQRDLVVPADSSFGVMLIVKTVNDEYYLIYARDNVSEAAVMNQVATPSQHGRSFLRRENKYVSIEMAVRIRRFLDFQPNIWPREALFNQRLKDAFSYAMATRGKGTRVFRAERAIEVTSWSFRTDTHVVAVAAGVSKPPGAALSLLGLLAPAMLVYSVLVLFFITSLAADFVVKPLNIISSGVEAINEEEYGVMIKEFSKDEFNNITAAFNEMSMALKQREIIRRHVSTRLYEQVQSGKQRSEKVELTVLSSDIRTFTSITEKYSPSMVVEMLNSYFTLMEEAIIENSGVIDKYIGDAIQAVFYHVDTDDKPAVRACRAAVKMRQKLREFNDERRTKGLFCVENGIGLATGIVVSGSIGSEKGRKDFSIIGKVTETAAELESQTVDVQSRILVCSHSREIAGSAFVFEQYSDQAWELKNV